MGAISDGGLVLIVMLCAAGVAGANVVLYRQTAGLFNTTFHRGQQRRHVAVAGVVIRLCHGDSDDRPFQALVVIPGRRQERPAKIATEPGVPV